MNKTATLKSVSAICILMLIIIGYKPIPLYASSADIVISSDKTEYVKGDTINVYIDIDAEVLPGDFEAYLLYQGDLLEYTGGNDIITGGEGILKISDRVMSPTRNSRRYYMKFKAKGTGECEFFFSDAPELYEFEEGYLMSVSVTELKLNIMSPKESSSDSSLSILKISPGVLTPEFSSDIKEYRTTVPISTEKLLVSAVAADEKAEVSVSGNTGLQYGNNRVTVTVKAENGDVTKYVIICERDGVSENNGNNVTDRNDNSQDIGRDDNVQNSGSDDAGRDDNAQNDDNGSRNDSNGFEGGVSGIKAESDGTNIKIYSGKAYTLPGAEDFDSIEQEMPLGYKKTSMKIDGIDITVYTSESSEDFIIVPLRNEYGELGLYSYDRLEKTIQRYKKSSEEKKANVMTDSIEALELANSYEKSLNTLTLIIAVLSALTMALLIVVIRMALKNKSSGLDD